jgi:hypothetical protein
MFQDVAASKRPIEERGIDGSTLLLYSSGQVGWLAHQLIPRKRVKQREAAVGSHETVGNPHATS